MPEREGVRTLTTKQRHKKLARTLLDVHDLSDQLEDDDGPQPRNRAQRRAVERAIVSRLRADRVLS